MKTAIEYLVIAFVIVVVLYATLMSVGTLLDNVRLLP
jgi:Flp pilus assembly pilin Flp